MLGISGHYSQTLAMALERYKMPIFSKKTADFGVVGVRLWIWGLWVQVPLATPLLKTCGNHSLEFLRTVGGEPVFFREPNRQIPFGLPHEPLGLPDADDMTYSSNERRSKTRSELDF
jgi:hypothetical protein